MPPKRVCSCKLHGGDSGETSTGPVQNIHTCKKFAKSVVSFLVDEGNLTARSKYLCNDCYEKACVRSAQDESTRDSLKKQKTEKYSVDEFLQLIHSQKADENTMREIVKASGNYLHQQLSSAKEINYAEKETLENMSYSYEMSAFNSILFDFLLALSGTTEITAPMLNAAESLMYLVNRNFIGKLNFFLNLILHFITGSRAVVELRSKYSPSGSYPTLMKYLDKYSENRNEIPTDKDIILFFDNNQVLARNWNVRYDSKALVSVVTTLISLCPPISAQLERNPHLSPLQWLHVVDTVEVSNLCKDEELDKYFRMLRNKFINDLLHDISQEQRQNNGLVDDIDTYTEKSRVVKFDSDQNMFYEQDVTNPYSSVECNCEGKADVTILDPLDLNPCSYDSVSKVMTHIQTESNREWNIVGCDGLPYLLCARIIERYHTCPNCSLIFKTKSDFEKHLDVNHHQAQINVNGCRTYGNILLIPGLGHYEINYTKAIFQLLWTVILIDLAKLLGFRSLKALVACEAATNHHKSWQIIQIFFKATARELLVPYVKTCISTSVNPTVEGVYDWLYKSKSTNMKFIFKCVFTYCFGLDLFRKGVRRNNYRVIITAMQKLSTLFYGLNKTQYMEIDCRHNITMNQCPPDVKQFISRVMALSQSGHPSKSEGGDFILESKNKRMKMLLPSGVPTFKRWLRVCRNFNSIEKMKDNACEDGSTDLTDAGFRKTDIQREIREWRIKLRTSRYLEKRWSAYYFKR